MTREEKDNKLAELMVELENQFPNYAAVILIADPSARELSLFSNLLDSKMIVRILDRAIQVESQHNQDPNRN